jgi:NRPS condensation-like uncharacterized protein
MTSELQSRPSTRNRATLIPFSIVDELSCYFDTSAEPNNFHIEARVPGQLQFPIIREAVIATLAAHPRASGRRAARRRLEVRFFWEYPPVLDVDPVSAAIGADEAELNRMRDEFLSRRPPLDVAPPVRVLVAAGPDAQIVILSVNHAAMDGVSCLELLTEISNRYAAAAAQGVMPGTRLQPQPDPRPTDPGSRA